MLYTGLVDFQRIQVRIMTRLADGETGFDMQFQCIFI